MKINIEEISVKELEQLLEMKKRRKANKCNKIDDFYKCKKEVFNHYLSNLNACADGRGHELISELISIVEEYGFEVNHARFSIERSETMFDSTIDFEFQYKSKEKWLIAVLGYDRITTREVF